MDSNETDSLAKKLEDVMKKIRRIGPVMRGSVTHMGTRHKQPYFSVGINGKTRVLYLGDTRAVVAKKYLANYGKLMALVDEMTILNMELLKRQGPDTVALPQKRTNTTNHISQT